MHLWGPIPKAVVFVPCWSCGNHSDLSPGTGPGQVLSTLCAKRNTEVFSQLVLGATSFVKVGIVGP